MFHEVTPAAPRERQTLRLSESKLRSLREWAVAGTGLTAAARVRDDDGRTALVRNGWTDGWFLPGGAVEPGETPAEAARREVREETGLAATVESPLVVVEQTYVAAESGEEWFSALYVVYAVTASGEIPDVSALGVDGEDLRAARWFDAIPDDLHDADLIRPYL